MDILLLFTLALILAVATFGFIVSKMLKIPFPPVLLFLGIILSAGIKHTVLNYDHTILTKLIIGLILPVFIFDIFSRIHIKKFNTLSWHAISTSAMLIMLSAILVGISAFALFDSITNMFIAILLGVIFVASSDFDIPLRKHSKTIGLFLYEESIFSAAIMFIYVFTAISLITQNGFIGGFKEIILGIGTGLLTGIFVFKIVRVNWATKMNHYILLGAAIICFWLAGQFDGSPIFAVATMGYFFGNVTVKDRNQFKEFSKSIVLALESILFLLVPFIIGFPFNFETILYCTVLYLMYLYARYFSLFIATYHDFSLGEKLFLTLYSPKGTALLSAVLFITLFNIPALEPLYQIILVVAVLSIIVSSVAAHLGHKFDQRL